MAINYNYTYNTKYPVEYVTFEQFVPQTTLLFTTPNLNFSSFIPNNTFGQSEMYLLANKIQFWNSQSNYTSLGKPAKNHINLTSQNIDLLIGQINRQLPTDFSRKFFLPSLEAPSVIVSIHYNNIIYKGAVCSRAFYGVEQIFARGGIEADGCNTQCNEHQYFYFDSLDITPLLFGWLWYKAQKGKEEEKKNAVKALENLTIKKSAELGIKF